MIKPKKSKKTIVIGIIAAVLLLLAIAVLSVNISEITVTGNKQYTAEQITNILFSGKAGRNTLYCLYKDRFKEHEQIPFVEDYKIVFQSPVKAEVIVYEKSVVGYVSYMGSYMYFDKDGIIVESASTKLEGIPWITGLKFGHIVLHQPLPVENDKIFGEILTLTQVLSTYGIGVDKIRYDSHGYSTLTQGDVEVYLGSSDNMDGKISEFNDMLPSLTGLSGILYLDTYDPTNLGQSYRFVKRN